MKYLIFSVILFIPSLGISQEVKNENGLCYRTIAGLEPYQKPEDASPILIQCFDEALSQCALEDSFSECLEASNESIVAALSVGRGNFDQTSLQSSLPGRQNAWNDFEVSFHDLQAMDTPDTDTKMAKFRASFFAVMKLNDLR